MKIDENWTLAYLLGYLTQITYVVMAIYAIGTTILFFNDMDDGQLTLENIPVDVQLGQFSEFSDIQLDGAFIDISNRSTTDVNITVSTDDYLSPAIILHLIKMFEYIILIVTLFLFAKLLKSIIDEKPFHKKSPGYLFAIGWILFLSPLIFLLFDWYAQSFFQQLALPEGIVFKSLSFNDNGFMMSGIFMIVLGYVFKEGTQLHEEQQLTV